MRERRRPQMPTVPPKMIAGRVVSFSLAHPAWNRARRLGARAREVGAIVIHKPGSANAWMARLCEASHCGSAAQSQGAPFQARADPRSAKAHGAHPPRDSVAPRFKPENGAVPVSAQ